MEQTTLTIFILVDDNIPFGDRIQYKEQGLIRILLQNLNGLNLGQDGLTLCEILKDSIKYERYIICLPETNTNWKNQQACTTFHNIINEQWKGSATYNSESIIPLSSLCRAGGTHTIIHPSLKPNVKNTAKITEEWGDGHGQQ